VVAVFINQCELTESVSHFDSSAQVRERSCASVFAVTTMVAPRRVLNIHNMIHATKADLPMPRPEATASLNISGISSDSFLEIWFAISTKIFSCHLRGPVSLRGGCLLYPRGRYNARSLMDCL